MRTPTADPVVLPTEPVAVIFKIPPTPARATQVPLIAGSCCAFDAGTATKDRSPVTSATTAVCETRFSRDVFVDIDFLSLVVNETFPPTAVEDSPNVLYVLEHFIFSLC
jgi:hypothetical protein